MCSGRSNNMGKLGERGSAGTGVQRHAIRLRGEEKAPEQKDGRSSKSFKAFNRCSSKRKAKSGEKERRRGGEADAGAVAVAIVESVREDRNWGCGDWWIGRCSIAKTKSISFTAGPNNNLRRVNPIYIFS